MGYLPFVFPFAELEVGQHLYWQIGNFRIHGQVFMTSWLLIGALSGIFYFRLLARGVGRLGTSSKIVGKVQLLVPVLLVLVSSRFPQLDLIPALLGFLLYKPALIIQFLSMP